MELKRQLLLSVVICRCLVDAYSVCLTDSLASDSIMFSELKEITVIADRRAVKVRSDKIIYDPSATVSGEQGNAYEAIKAIPGITVQSSGDISINGFQNVAVSFDGRKTILNGESLLNFLKSIPVENIENIELINSAGAVADGSDPTTILNLVRRRKKDDCYSIGANIDGQIWKAKQIYGSVFGENYRNGHCISVNYSWYVARNPSELLTDRPYLDFKERLTQVYDRRRKDSSHFLSVSYVYTPSEGPVIGTSINYNHFKRKEPAVMTTSVPFVADQTITSNNALFVSDNVFGEIYFKNNPSYKNTDWVAACDFFRYRSLESQLMEDNIGMSVDGDMEGKTYGIVGSFDFNRSISTSWRLSFGTRFSYVDMNSEGSYIGFTSKETGSNSHHIDNLDSSFGYNENVNALYAEGKCSYGIFNASVGLRGEQSNLNTFFSGNESAGSRDLSNRYFHIYPSMSFMLSTSQMGSWMLTYTNKVTRPRFADLDPFIHIFDDITHVGGNINLKEAYRHSLNLIWSDNSHWRVMAVGELVSNDIVKYYRELSDRIVYVTPENIPSHMQLLISATGSDLNITYWWKLSATANLIYSTYRFSKVTELSPNSLWTPVLDMKNIFRLPYQIMAEMDVSFRGGMAFGQAQTSLVWNTYMGLRKNFCDDRFSISLYVKDIFNSNHFKSTILLTGRKAILYEKEYEDMRKIGISISYRISGGEGNSKKDARNAWIDELNRVNL